MRKLTNLMVCAVLSLAMLMGVGVSVGETYASEYVPQTSTKASILIDADSGKVLYENNSHDRMPIASIVKLMTIMLTLENVDNAAVSLDDKVLVSENASGMGGSQIFLDANCEYVLGELLKSVIVCSANDSSVALAEYIAGSEDMFVKKMNDRAGEMGLGNTNYVNCTGLPAENQYSCAADISKILCNVLKYDQYREYCKIWMEDFQHPSGRTTEMTNTNRLSRFYDGCLGGKTGSSSEAGYCLSVGAERNGLRLISVVLGASSTKDRFKGAAELLDFGFANYENYVVNTDGLACVLKPDRQGVKIKIDGLCKILTKKGESPKYDVKSYIPNKISKCDAGEVLGHIDIIVDGQVYSTLKVIADETVLEPGFVDNLKELYKDFI